MSFVYQLIDNNQHAVRVQSNAGLVVVNLPRVVAEDVFVDPGPSINTPRLALTPAEAIELAKNLLDIAVDAAGLS